MVTSSVVWRGRSRFGAVAVVAVLAIATSGVAIAGGRNSGKAKPPQTATAAELAPLVTALASADTDAATKAAIALGEMPEPAAHEALLDGLALGLPPSVATIALSALTLHPAPPDVTALRRYAVHRDPAVRVAALGALVDYPDPAAHAAILAGLHDMAGMVRGAAAMAAAKGHVRGAVEPMLVLLARGEEPVARALAEMADLDLARRLADQLGQVSDPLLAHCLGWVLKRADFGPDAARVEVVRAIAKISDNAAVDALTDYLDASPKTPARASRAEAQKIVEARLGGVK